eukprot:987478-Amphidinium_carterae.1
MWHWQQPRRRRWQDWQVDPWGAWKQSRWQNWQVDPWAWTQSRWQDSGNAHNVQAWDGFDVCRTQTGRLALM